MTVSYGLHQISIASFGLKEPFVKQVNFCIRHSVKNSRFAKSIMEKEGNDFITY